MVLRGPEAYRVCRRPRSHPSIGGPSCTWRAVSSTSLMLQNFQSSFAARVPKQHLVDVERAQFTVAEAVGRLGHVRDEFGELRSLVARHRLACLPTL